MKKSLTLQWTLSAIECYQRNFNCDECTVFEIIGKQCRMKTIIKELVKQHGAPKEEINYLLKEEL